MSFIRTISEDEAEGPLFDIYDAVQQKRGRVSNVLRIQSLHPKALQAHLDLYMTLLYGKSPLGRFERELIGVVVSVANGCDYCTIHHADALGKYADEETLVDAVRKDWRKAGLTDAQKALADYVEGLTLSPAKGRKEAVETLRSAGFDDEAILHATEVTAYFNFVNRLVHGLGVDLEDNPHQDFNY